LLTALVFKRLKLRAAKTIKFHSNPSVPSQQHFKEENPKNKIQEVIKQLVCSFGKDKFLDKEM